MTALRTARLAAAGSFFLQGLVFISVTQRLPEISRVWRLDELKLSLVMLLVVLLSGAGSVGAEVIAKRSHSALVLRIGCVLTIIGLLIASWAPAFGVFLVGIAIWALAVGAIDAGSNMQAVSVEAHYGRAILPSFHGAWTFGGILATIAAIAMAHVELRYAILPLLLVPLAMAFAPYLRRDTIVDEVADPNQIPWRRIGWLGLAMILFYMVDTASTVWGPKFLETVHATPDRWLPLATLPYLAATLAARIGGDHLVDRYGATRVLRVGGVLAAAGLAVIVFSPSTIAAILGFTIVGCGIAVIAPLSFSAAGAIAGGTDDPVVRQARVDMVIARFNQFNYLGALLGAVLTGVFGAGNLRLGYAVPMVLILAIIPLAKHFGIIAGRAR
ncbi:MFS transporter [Janibacter sp. GXQ6167]|uniref:MFS transporter n=1 Tax=Janibacter sp. GXQ6167 TaxID=3240791 RepID=UPI003523F550